MKIQTVLDNLAAAADDNSTEFESKARTWLNLVRVHCAKRARWRGSVRVDTFTTDSTITDGLYTLRHYEHLAEDVLYDETNKQNIEHESHGLLNQIDVAKEVTGPPSWWGDAGQDERGNRRIYLWPIPSATATVRFTGTPHLEDLVEGDDEREVDPLFGRVTFWADVWEAGLSYHYAKDQNESTEEVFTKLRIFDRLIDNTKSVDHVAPSRRTRLQNVRWSHQRNSRGRFDPAHFQN